MKTRRCCRLKCMCTVCEQARSASLSDDFWRPAGPQSDWPWNRCYYTSMRTPIWSLTPHCVITPTDVCVCVFVRPLSPSLSLFPNSVVATVFHLTPSISPWTTSSRSPAGGLWSALCGCKPVMLSSKTADRQNKPLAATSLWPRFLESEEYFNRGLTVGEGFL